MGRMRVVVIGAGVMGTTVAFRLAQGGASVTVLEAAHVGGGTSGTSFAWTNANNKTPRAYHDLNVAGMAAHAALRDEFGATPWWHGGGSVEWCAPEERAAQAERVRRLQEWCYAAEWITPRELAGLEPEIDLAAVADAPVAFFPDEGWLDPVVYAQAMMAAARRHGARLVRVRVTGIVTRDGAVAGVRTANGALHEADRVVNCAGRWANEALVDGGLHLPLALTVGFLVLTPPVPSGLRRVVRTPLVDLRPDGAGRLMLHRNATDALVSFDTEPSPALPEALDLVRRAARLLPAIAAAGPEAVRIALRPIPADGHSAVGSIARLPGYSIAITHSAVTMAPHLGALAAEEVLTGRERPELAPFRPARFFN